jgi:hypothetical protein
VLIVKDTFVRLGIFGLITKVSNVKFICAKSVLENTIRKQRLSQCGRGEERE